VNSAPRATDTLANERTFLAYVRTALAFIGFGFVVARFALFEREVTLVAHISIAGTGASTAFGTIMALAGILTGVYGSLRYTLTDRALRRDKVSAMPAWVAVAGGIVIAVVGLIVAINLFRTQ
jgi:putative membrane protein